MTHLDACPNGGQACRGRPRKFGVQHQSDNPTPTRRASGRRLASRRELLSPLGSEARLRAELACFTELLALLAHDLSNPLQSLTVLIELTLDDADLGPETVNKLRQALAAVEDMRGSIRTLSEFAQAGQRHGPTASFRRSTSAGTHANRRCPHGVP